MGEWDVQRNILVVVFANDRFDGFCAGHGSFLAHEGSNNAEAIASDLGHVGELCGSDLMLNLKFVHDEEVSFFLIPHFLRKGQSTMLSRKRWHT